jgi:hypothetical protein
MPSQRGRCGKREILLPPHWGAKILHTNTHIHKNSEGIHITERSVGSSGDTKLKSWKADHKKITINL